MQNWPFSKPLEFLHKIKYGGAVGKKASITHVALIVLAIAVVAEWGKENPILYIAAAVLVVYFGGLRSIDKTLKDHPELALMDGAEQVRIREIEASAKGLPNPPDSPSISAPLGIAANPDF